jgi:hypothetical protein
MKLSTSLVAVKKISCTKPRSLFSDDELEKAAQSILESEGVINPIVIRRTSLKSYELVDGAFEFYAAARAREIDPRKGEMISVFIIEPENEEVLTKQVELFRKQKNDSSLEGNFTTKDLEKFLINLELRIDKLAKELLEEATAKVYLETQNIELKKQLSNRIEALDIFTKLDVDKIYKKLIKAGFNPKKANQVAAVVVNERKKEQFKSLNDVIERVKVSRGKQIQKGISEKNMIHIIESLSEDD